MHVTPNVHSSKSILAAIAIVMIGLALAPRTLAQGPANLAEQNAVLEKKVADLESQLEMARTRIAVLTDEVARLRKQVVESKNRSATSPGAGGGTKADDPMASPDALFAHLQKTYAQTMGGMPLDTRAEEVRYRRAVGQWVRTMQRSIKGPAEWRIRVVNLSSDRSRTPKLTFIVVDRASGKDISAASSTVFPSRFARMIRDNPTQELWRLKVRLSALPSLNAQRKEKGASDEPKFIGPYAEFGFEVAVRSFEPAP